LRTVTYCTENEETPPKEFAGKPLTVYVSPNEAERT